MLGFFNLQRSLVYMLLCDFLGLFKFIVVFWWQFISLIILIVTKVLADTKVKRGSSVVTFVNIIRVKFLLLANIFWGKCLFIIDFSLMNIQILKFRDNFVWHLHSDICRMAIYLCWIEHIDFFHVLGWFRIYEWMI